MTTKKTNKTKNTTIYDILGYKEEDLIEMANSVNAHYLSFPIKKSSGKIRWIDAPDNNLKDIQKSILYKFLYKFEPHQKAYGFVKNRNAKDGAELHLGAKLLISMDLLNFFNSIKITRVKKCMKYLFKRFEKLNPTFTYTIADANIIATLLTYLDQLPQGAPTSPAIANLICIGLDYKLENLSKREGYIYHRYADDINFSRKTKTVKNPKLLIDEIEGIVKSSGFRLNYKKTRITRQNRRMKVTGVVVNEKLSVERWRWRNFQAKLHNLKRDGKTISIKEYQQLRGWIEWMRILNPKRGTNFIKKLGELPLKNS